MIIIISVREHTNWKGRNISLLKSTLKRAKTTSCKVNIIGMGRLFNIQCEESHITVLTEEKKGGGLLVCVSIGNEHTVIVHTSSTIMPECPSHLLAYWVQWSIRVQHYKPHTVQVLLHNSAHPCSFTRIGQPCGAHYGKGTRILGYKKPSWPPWFICGHCVQVKRGVTTKLCDRILTTQPNPFFFRSWIFNLNLGTRDLSSETQG